MNKSLFSFHQLLRENRVKEAQDVFRRLLHRLPENKVLSKSYIMKSYELNKAEAFKGLSGSQVDAHSLIVRQMLIENSEEFDRRVSRLI